MEKIKVNLSYNTYNLLIHDMENFSFDEKDEVPNKNLFYNIVIKNMYLKRKENEENRRNQLTEVLSKYSLKDKTNELLNDIENIYANKDEDKTNRSHGYYISFRPSKNLKPMYEEIEMCELKGNTISSYYRSLLNEYAHLSQDERERIVFNDEIKIIESAIKNKKTILLKINKITTECIPYEIVRTNDELYNYLIAGEINSDKIKYFSFHIYKCVDVIKTRNVFSLTQEQIKLFEELIFRGPKNIEQRTALTKVKLTKRGVKIFNKYYLNRPIPLSIEGDIYTFNTSVDNIFVYFTRFGKEAYILEPDNLKGQMRKFHKRAFALYSDYIEKDQD